MLAGVFGSYAKAQENLGLEAALMKEEPAKKEKKKKDKKG